LIENQEREKYYTNDQIKNNDGEEDHEQNENEINTNNNKNSFEKKIIIFIIHTTRFLKNYVYTEDEIEKSIEGKELISHLANYSQFFIDNINGSSINVLDLISLRNEELIDKNEIIDLKDTIYKNIYNSFVKINYTFKNKMKNLVESKYIEENIKRIMKNETIINKIIDIYLKSN
jgi:hypothetical protein